MSGFKPWRREDDDPRVPLEPWELNDGDDALHAVRQWSRAWHQENPGAFSPPLRFAQHLGREALDLMEAKTPRKDMAQTFWEAGFDGVCMCGKTVKQVLNPEPS